MASKGRGGGGRGRGRATLSFSVEQLGLATGELLPGPVLQPPPLFPPVEFKPAPLLTTPFNEEQLQQRAKLFEYFTKSCAFIRLKLTQPEREQFFDAEQSNIPDKPFQMDWSHAPAELKPSLNKRKRKGVNSCSIPKKIEKKNMTNLTSWLEELEKKETMEEGTEKEIDDSDKKKDEDEPERGEGDELEEDDMDEEMDDGTDYNQNYFDNGEGYLDDEDDNLDDGPIY